jgi:hypothetical protein
MSKGLAGGGRVRREKGNFGGKNASHAVSK